MIIDSHCHVQIRKTLPQNTFPAAATALLARPIDKPAPAHGQIDPAVWKVNDDPEGKKWAADFEHLGIDIAFNLIIDWGISEGWNEEAPLSIEDIHHEYSLVAQKHPGKLYNIAGVDPRRPNAVRVLEKAVKEWGFKGLKLHPALGFYPNDRRCYRLYEKCAELGVPVIIHTGYGVFHAMKYVNPVYMDEPARDFPEIQFIQAHSGGGIGHLWEEAVTVARARQNISLELGEIAPTVIKGGRRGNAGKYKDHIPTFIDILDIMRNLLSGGSQNILFGTDYPFMAFETLEQWVQLFKNLPEVADRYGYDFSPEEADLICYKNAARILKIPIEEKKTRPMAR